jgi:hypothetical protein
MKKINIDQLSKSTLVKLGMIFSARAVLDTDKYEIVFYGTRDQFKKAVKILEEKDIDYTVDWRHFRNSSDPYTVILKIDKLLLKTQQHFRNRRS